MAFDFITENVQFDAPGEKEISFRFSNVINDFGLAIKGFNMHYPNSADHQVENIGVEISDAQLNNDGNVINAKVVFAMQNSSGDVGQASIDITAFADLGAY